MQGRFRRVRRSSRSVDFFLRTTHQPPQQSFARSFRPLCRRSRRDLTLFFLYPARLFLRSFLLRLPSFCFGGLPFLFPRRRFGGLSFLFPRRRFGSLPLLFPSCRFLFPLYPQAFFFNARAFLFLLFRIFFRTRCRLLPRPALVRGNLILPVLFIVLAGFGVVPFRRHAPCLFLLGAAAHLRLLAHPSGTRLFLQPFLPFTMHSVGVFLGQMPMSCRRRRNYSEKGQSGQSRRQIFLFHTASPSAFPGINSSNPPRYAKALTMPPLSPSIPAGGIPTPRNAAAEH